MKSRGKTQFLAELYGGFFALVGVFLYGLYQLIPIFPIQTLSAFCLVMAIVNLFRSYIIERDHQTAVDRHQDFENLKKEITEKYKKDKNVSTECEKKDKKSEDDAHS